MPACLLCELFDNNKPIDEQKNVNDTTLILDTISSTQPLTID